MHLGFAVALRCGTLLASCTLAANTLAVAAITPAPTHAPAMHQGNLPASGPRQLVYVANAASNSISVFPDIVNNPKPIGSITAGVSSPQGVCVDYSGNLYVANGGSNTVTVYHPGAIAPFLTYSVGIGAPSDVTVDRHGTVYVANQKPGSIAEYAKGSTKPTAFITDVQSPTALALDRAGDLFVTDVSPAGGPSRVLEYTPDSQKGIDLGLSFKYASGIAFDPKSGDLYVADEAAGAVYGYHQPFALRPHGPTPDQGPFVIIQVGGALHIIWILTTPTVLVSQFAFNEVSAFANGLPKQTGFFNQGIFGPTAATQNVRLF